MDPGIRSTTQGEASNDELSDVELPGEDRSSSLSEIEDKDPEQEDNEDESDELSDPAEDNESEAETERLEESPNNLQRLKNVILSSYHGSQIYERSPSKLQNQTPQDDTDTAKQAEDNELLLENNSFMREYSNAQIRSSPKAFHMQTEVSLESATAANSIEAFPTDNSKLSTVSDSESRKRKRSMTGDNSFDNVADEPMRKRTGSVKVIGEDLNVEDELPHEEEADHPKSSSGELSGEEGAEAQDDNIPNHSNDQLAIEDDHHKTADVPPSPPRRGRRKRKIDENGIQGEDEAQSEREAGEEVPNGANENADNEGDDEAEATLRTEEEFERKRLALEKLGTIEQQLAAFRDRLYDVRMEQLNREEEMLRSDPPTHPEYLAMIKCIDERRDERFRIADKLYEYKKQTIQTSAKAGRSQILTQFQQKVRTIREENIEKLGKMWYDIQRERRTFAGSVPEYTLKFPTKQTEQVRQHNAYAQEVSILSGIGKYVGFPAAPSLSQASQLDYEEDMEKMGHTKHQAQLAAVQPLQELARSIGSAGPLKRSEEQFIEQNAWANAQHPSHAHLLQRQASAQHPPRTNSPFSQVPQRRHSHQPGMGVPISGTFSTQSSSHQHQSNGASGPQIPFSNSSHSHTLVPSPLASSPTSLSPQQIRPGRPTSAQQQETGHGQGMAAQSLAHDQQHENLAKLELAATTAELL